MAIDFDKLRKKAKRRDEQKQIKDNYEFTKSMYEGVKNNRENVSNKTYQKYYNDYKNNTKAYIRDEKKTQLNSVLNMFNPKDDVSFSQAKKNFQNAQTKKEELRSTYDKYKDDYERINGQGQTKNKLLSKMEEMSDKLYGDDTVNTEYNRATRRKYEAAQREKEQKEKYQKQQDSNNKLLKNTDVQKLVGSAYKNKQNADIALQEYQRSKQSGQASFGDNVQAENYSIYNKSYETAMQALKKRGYDAESLLDTYTRNKNKQETEKIAKDSSKFADKHPITSRAAYIAAQMGQVAAVPDMIKQGVSNAVSKEYKPMDTNTSAFIATNFRNAVQEKNTENLYNYVKEKSGSDTAGKVVSFLDQTGLSVADMLSIAWLPEPVTLGIMSCGAAANTAVEATQRGLSADKALYTATAAGVAESLFEKISLEKFNALQATGRTGVLNTVKDILKQSFTEGSEEAFTDISNAITDQIINGDMSELSLKYQDYKKQGATEQQARNTVAKDFGMQIGESFLGGALSGAVVGGVGSAINKFSFNDGNARELGFEAKTQSNEDIKNLIDTGLSKDKKSKAYKYAEELNQKAKKTHIVNSDNSTDVFSGTSVNNGGVDYSKLSDKRLGQLQLEILKEGFKENISTAVKGEKNEAKINRTVNKIVSGIDLNKSDVENIASSEKALGAINEQFGSDFTSKNISTSALADLSTKLKSGFTDYSFVFDGLNKYQQRTENTTNTTPNVEEGFSAVQQSNNPRYNVNAVVSDTNGNQTPIKIEGKHPFSISEDKSDIKLRTSAGEIEYNNVNLADNTQRILVNEIVNNNFGNSGANAVYLNFAQNKPENFDGDIRTYVKQAKTIYELGLAKPELSYNDFVRKNSVFIPSLRLLGKTAINIYRAGQTDATNYNNFVVSQRNDVKAPTLAVRHIEGEYTNTSNSDSTIDDVLIKTAKKVGVDIERRSDGKSAGNGQFIPSLAKIMVNGDGSGEYNALLHELGEFGLAYNESEYKNVQTAIRDWFVKEKGAEDFNTLVDAYVDTYSKAEGSKTREEALNELTNDAISGLFSTDEGIESFVNYLDETKTPAQKKNILETITDFLKSVIEKIKDVIKNSNLQSAAKTAMQMEQKQAEHIRNQFLSVLDGASKNLKNGVEVDENPANALNVEFNSDTDFDKNIKYVANMKPVASLNGNEFAKGETDLVTQVSDYFKSIGNKVESKYGTIVLNRTGVKSSVSHGIGRKKAVAFMAVPDVIKNGRIIDYTDNYKNSKKDRAVFAAPLSISGEEYYLAAVVEIDKYKNSFYLHEVALKNKKDTLPFKTEPRHESGLLSDNVSIYSLLNKLQNVNKNSNNVKFSLDTTIEETKDLVAIHNTTENKLISALELGGLPSPSIAIMKAENISGNNQFGDISLVFDKNTIDPQKNSANKVYSSDAYTPISVKAEHKLNEKKAWNLYSKISGLTRQKLAYKPNASSFHPDNFKDMIDNAGSTAELVDKYKNDYAFKELYLADKSEPVRDIVRKEKKTTLAREDTGVFDFLNDNIKATLEEIEDKPLLPSKLWVEKYDDKIKQSIADYYKNLIPGISDEGINNIFNNSDEFKTAFQRKAFVKKAVDYLKNGAEKVELVSDDEATHNLIDDKINQNEYESWLNDLFAGVVEKKGIWKGNDPFTESGNRKSWESLYWDYNLENIVKAMNNQNAQGGNFLVSNIIGGSAKTYNSLEEIRGDKARLKNIDNEKYEQIRKNFYKRFQEIAQSMTKNDNPFAVADIIVEGIAKTETKSGLANYLKTELKGWANYSDMAVDDIWTLVNDIRALPTSYFEAKPQKAVYFNEVYTAVIPDNASQKLKNALKNAGVSYAEYKANNEQSRLDIINSLEDVRFSRDVDTRKKDFSKALSKNEYRQFYSIIDNRETGRIIENSAVTIYENGNIDNAKIICYNGNKFSPEITAVYRLLGNDETIHGENDLSAQIIAKAEKEKYSNEEIVRLLRTNIEYYGYILEKYDTESGRFRSLTGTSRNGSENFENSTDRSGVQQENRYANFSRDVDYAEYSQLKRENKHLKEVNELLKHQFELTNGREVSTNALLAAGRNIIKLTPTRVTGVEVAEDMKNWHTLDTSAQLYNATYNLAEKLVDNERKQKYQPTDQEQDMLDYLKNTKIKLSDKQKSEVAYYYGSYGKYRNAARGKINITDDGILLDDLSNEMEEMFGNLISNDNSQDLPITLLDLVNTYKDRYIDNEYGYDKQEYLESLANDILSVYFKTPLYETKADKTEKRFLKARSRYADRVNQYQKELASEKEKHRKEFSDFRRQLLQQNREYRANLKEETVQYKADYRKKQKEKREKSMLYKSFQRSAIRLAQLAKQDKKKHIPNNMVEAVKGIVDVISFGSKLDSEIYSKLNALDRSFKSLKNNDDYEMVTSVYNNYVSQRIDQLQTMIGDRTAKDLTIDELRVVDDLVRTTVQVCNNVNKLFYAERNKTIESSVSKVSEELEKFKGNKKLDLGIINSIKYGSMKPEYFFEYLGSDELLKLYRDVRKGEDTWAVTVDNSRNYANDVRDKYKWKEWDRKKRYEITTAAGDKLNLNLEQLMAIYAMSNRRQTLNHIVHGGVVITDKPKSAIQTLKDKNYKWNDSLTHKLAFEDIAKIKSMLTEDQKSYVRDMVKYLSTDMAEKGNEISRQLYDVELFKEENYYPARTAKNYMHKSSVETIGAKKLINSGFTNATIEKAENPLLLEEFDNVWASHIDEMASYNAFALPLENFDRVYNYQSSNGDKYNSIRTLVENAYGKKATSYISDLLEDLNGGVIHEVGSDVVDKLTSMFKKNAVFASASVAIQQPSAIGRALSIIDTKYFAKTTFTKRSYEEIKKYAPIAIIKEMGYFDTNMAQSTVDYLNNVDYKGKEKLSAFFKDGSFRDEVFGIAASKADEMTWAHIWNACKAETKDKHPELTGEESLKKAGERFTEVITKTQVYDSVFSRSALMRSKNGAVKMATAFMAEPTTSLNMLVNATVQAKRGKFSKKKATRIVASLVIASVINSLLQSIVTAARNDDDDKTYFEKYLAELIPNFIDNANPVIQIAFVKDIVSIFQGYDVTRADMSVVSDLYNSINNLNSDKLSFEEKTESLAGALGAFFSLPVKNVIRDINSVANVVKGAKKDFKFDSAMTKEATKSNIKETLLTDDALAVFGLDLFPEKDKNQMIYESIINDDKQMYKRIADNVNNPDNYIKKGLIENDERVATAGLDYLNGDIKSVISTAKQLESDGFDYELAFKSIKSYASEIEKAAGYKADEDTDKYDNSIDTLLSSGMDDNTIEKAIDAVKLDEEKEDTQSELYNKTDLINAVNSSDKSIIKTIIDNNIETDMDNGKTKSEAEKSIKSSLSSAFKEEYLSDESKRKEIKSKLKVTGYFDDEDFTNWEASSYNTEAMIEAFKTNDTKTILSYVNKRVEAKVANGMTEDNAVFGLKTSITNQYKQKFINGNADERAKIITIMTKSGLYGDRKKVIAYINQYWLK